MHQIFENVNGKIVTCASFSIYSGNVENFIENYTYWNYQSEAKYNSIWFIMQTKRQFSLSCLKYSIYWAVLIFKATDKKQQFLLVRDWCPIWMVILPYYSFIIKLYVIWPSVLITVPCRGIKNMRNLIGWQLVMAIVYSHHSG